MAVSYKEEVKTSARGRWTEILPALAGIPPDILDEKHHPCPKCAGKDRFRMIDQEEGALFCNQCFNRKNGDGLAALQWLLSISFRDALNLVADHLGIARRRIKNPEPDEELAWRPWNEGLGALWARTKDLTGESLRPNGARIARWGKYQAIVFPVIVQEERADKTLDDNTSPSTEGFRASGWVMCNSNGQLFALSDGRQEKILATRGSKTGFLGAAAFKNHSTAEFIWKVEGLSDLLTLFELIPHDQRQKHIVVSNPFGSREKPHPVHLAFFQGKVVHVIHDNDKTGQEGARRWASAALATATNVRIINLPSPTQPTLPHPSSAAESGFDLRDWVRLGGTFEQLLTIAFRTEYFTGVSRDELVDESETDPSRLAAQFVRERLTNIATYHDEIYYWREGCWYKRNYDRIRADVSLFLREEFHNLNIEAQERTKTTNEPAPSVHKITKTLLESVISLIKAYTCVSGDIPWGSLLHRPEGDFDVVTDYAKKDWIAVNNGILQVYELTNGNGNLSGAVRIDDCILDHTSDWWSPHKLPFNFDPEAGPENRPQFEEFLAHNLEGDAQDVATLQEWAGYTLVPDTNQQRFLLLAGEGANGKSVYCATLKALLGENNVSHVPLELFGHRFQLTSTLGKLANVATEVGELDKIAEGYLKSFTAGEPMMFDRKGKEPIQATPTARLVLATNNPPRWSDKSQGLWRRLLFLKFCVEIEQSRRIQGLDKFTWWLKSGEMPAILNWALEGLIRLRYQGEFTESDFARSQKAKYRRDVNPALAFLEDNYEEADDVFRISKRTIFDEYKEWCKANGYFPLAYHNFCEEVPRRFPHLRTTRQNYGQREREWAGLTKKTHVEIDF